MPKPAPVSRNYEARDREAVRKICCDTGFIGTPIDPVFEDRELFADYLTSYYTDKEPEACFVVEQEGEVKGYLLGSCKPEKQKRYDTFNNIRLFLKGISRYPSYSKATRSYIKWILFQSWKEVPPAPKCRSHFHFNLLPEVQSVKGTRDLLNHFFNFLRTVGESEVFGQVVTFENRRGTRILERYGFKVLEKKEITKYREVYDKPVYLTTVLKDLNDERFKYL
ncbi:MAG: GNAT family acetyltransferase [Chthoniobacterales bacterium]